MVHLAKVVIRYATARIVMRFMVVGKVSINQSINSVVLFVKSM